MNLTVAEAMTRCWMRVDLGAVEDNYSRACSLAGGAFVIGVLKADAYGLGAVAIARTLKRLGARLVAVACVNEALQIKRYVDVGVLVLGMTGEDLVDQAIQSSVALTAYSLESARFYSERAMKLGKKCPVHIKVNTGLNRLGFDDQADLIEAARLPGLAVEGIYTHLGLHTEALDQEQFERFDAFCRVVKAPVRHVLDSIGLFLYPNRCYDAVRAGAYIYGSNTGLTPDDSPKNVVTFQARVAQTRMVKKGALIGYDDDHPLDSDRLVATISAGFVDGYPRKSDNGFVEIRGNLARVLGIACMDQMMVDITGIPGVQPGDVVTMLGNGITLKQYALWHDLNRNEAMSRINRRVPRIYVERSGETYVGDFLQ